MTLETDFNKSRKFYKDLNTLSMKQRNGLFSDPISLAVGDVHYVAPTRKIVRKDKGPNKSKGFFTSKMKVGRNDHALFSNPKYNAISDPYNEPCKSLQLRSSVEKIKKRPFTAGGRVKQKNPTSFHCGPVKEKENKRIGAGNVRLREPNFVTSKSKVGGGKTTPGVCMGGKTIKYIEDDYDREKDYKREQSRRHKEKIPKPFASTVKQRTTFTKDEQCYTIEGLTLKLKKELYNYDKVKHPQPFRPSNPAKKGYNKTLEQFPSYTEDPGRPAKKESTKHYAAQTGKWRPTARSKSKPCPSIVENPKNKRQLNYSRFY
ncbi:unnamed protein product [Moneuplotes crassus]|uniref:Cilia-and flagella-associated protein 96 n=1 Tax=Euplotes crassus TaxID=5936 RepID=A0AAD2D155_EUPCR|nr:unnamed protein product [Moneuplotes crassus]